MKQMVSRESSCIFFLFRPHIAISDELSGKVTKFGLCSKKPKSHVRLSRKLSTTSWSYLPTQTTFYSFKYGFIAVFVTYKGTCWVCPTIPTPHIRMFRYTTSHKIRSAHLYYLMTDDRIILKTESIYLHILCTQHHEK